MKVSELITQLEALKDEFGDLDTLIDFGFHEKQVDQVYYWASDNEMDHAIAISPART